MSEAINPKRFRHPFREIENRSVPRGVAHFARLSALQPIISRTVPLGLAGRRMYIPLPLASAVGQSRVVQKFARTNRVLCRAAGQRHRIFL
jgi:hypothetical protein